MRVLVLLLSSLLALAACQSRQSLSGSEGEFREWKRENGVQYQSELEHQARLRIFQENKLVVEAHNKKYDNGESTFFMGMTKFADLTDEEYRTQIQNPALKHEPAELEGRTVDLGAEASVPASIDWRQYGAVTGIKNQGQCGSCWSFAATGALEGQYFRRWGKLRSFSEQQLVSCDSFCHGCAGGTASSGFRFWKDVEAATLDYHYPYTSGQHGYTGQCYSSTPNVWIKDYAGTPSGDENALKTAVGTIGPIAVAIDASKSSFKMYTGGVYYEPACSTWDLDHAVLAVGYGTDQNGWDYWLVKNTWGTNWGANGYIKMLRNYNNMCGIATQCSYPILYGP